MIWVVLFVLLVIFLLYRRVRSLTRGMNVAGDPGREARVRRYARAASAEERAKDEKLRKKAARTRNAKKQKKLFDRASAIWVQGARKEKIAIQNAEGQGKKHGIRVKGTERGWWPEEKKSK